MSDVDTIAQVLINELEAGPAHARIVAKDIVDRLLGDLANTDDEPLVAEVGEGRCLTCGQAVPEYGGITMDRDRHEIRYNGKRCGSLTGREFAVLDMLYRAKGRTVTKDMVMHELYSLAGEEIEIKIIDVFICKIRHKITSLGIRIGTAWGRGYYLEEPDKEAAA